MTKKLRHFIARHNLKNPTLKLFYLFFVCAIIFLITVLFVINTFHISEKQKQSLILNYYDRNIAQTFTLINSLQQVKLKLKSTVTSPVKAEHFVVLIRQIHREKAKIIKLQAKYQERKFEQSIARLERQLNQFIPVTKLVALTYQQLNISLHAATLTAEQINLLFQQERTSASQKLSDEYRNIEAIIKLSIFIAFVIGLPLGSFLFIQLRRRTLKSKITCIKSY